MNSSFIFLLKVNLIAMIIQMFKFKMSHMVSSFFPNITFKSMETDLAHVIMRLFFLFLAVNYMSEN